MIKEPKKKKLRKNITIDPDKQELLKKLKEQSDLSESELIDFAISRYLDDKKNALKIVAFFNQKGGVAKTTSVINIAAGLVNKGKKILAIDLDTQGNLTKGLGVYHQNKNSIYEVLKGDASYKDCIVETKGLHLIPATLSLAGFEYLDMPGKEFLLKNRMKDLEGYDYVPIDCGPSLTKLTLNALTWSNRVYVPIQTEYYALEGVAQLLQTIEMAKSRLLNQDLELKGVFCTMYDGRRNLDKEVESKIREHFGNVLMTTKIRENVKLAEAPAKGLTIFEHDPKSNGARDYTKLVEEFLEREEF